MAQEIKVPDIGDFDAVEVIEVLVAEGDTVSEGSVIALIEAADSGDDAAEAAPDERPVDGMPAETAEVVSLDSFRKSPS